MSEYVITIYNKHDDTPLTLQGVTKLKSGYDMLYYNTTLCI